MPESITLWAQSFASGILAGVKSVACNAPPMYPAPEITCLASDMHMVMQNTTSAEANTLLHSNSALIVPNYLACDPPLNVIEQITVDTPSQSSTVTINPSQDISSLITDLQSSILVLIGAMLQPVVSCLLSLESSLQAQATVPEAPYSPSAAAVLWWPTTSGPVDIPRHKYDYFALDDNHIHDVPRDVTHLTAS